MAKRPFLIVTVAMAAGICSAIWLAVPAIPLFISCLVILVIAAGIYRHPSIGPRNQRQLISLLLLCGCVTAGMLRTRVEMMHGAGDISALAHHRDRLLMLGEVLDVQEARRSNWKVTLAAKAVCAPTSDWQAVQGRVLVWGKRLGSLQLGEQILIAGDLRLPDSPRNPRSFDYRAYLRARGVTALFYCADDSVFWRSQSAGTFSIMRMAAGVRAEIEARLATISTGQELALMTGLLVGKRQEIDDGIIESFARTGLIHILAVSGLHAGFIMLLLFILCNFFRVPKKWHWLPVIVGLIFFAHLTGLKPPVVRASIMASVILLARALERRSDIYNSLGFAAFLILAWQPLQLFQLGFQLSFAAVAGIAFLYQPLSLLFARIVRFRQPILRWAVSLLAVSFAAQMATLPFSVSTFGRIPLTAIWGNLVVIPAAFVIVATAAISCLVSPLSEFAAQAYGAVAEFTAGLMLDFTHWLARIPYAFVEGVYIPPLLLLSYLLILVLIARLIRKRNTRWLLAAILLCLNLHIWQEALRPHQNMRLTVFDIGQGDAVFFEFPNGEAMLIDTGPWYGDSDAGERVLLPYFFKHGIGALDAVVITHPHADHLGGLPSVLHGISIDTVYHCGFEIDSWLEDHCERMLDSLGTPYRTLSAGQRLGGIESALVTAIYPTTGMSYLENINDASVVLKVVFGEQSFLLPGDAELLAETRMLQSPEVLDSDFLKAGHHGSRTSSSRAFLDAVTPAMAVVSAGRRNKFDHPHAEIVARYDSLGIPLLRTDVNGAIVFESDGRRIWRTR